MNKPILIAVIVFAVMLSSCDGGWKEVNPNAGGLDSYYEDPARAYSIRYHSDWRLAIDDIVSFTNTKSEGEPEKVVITKIDMQLKPIPLSEYVGYVTVATNMSYNNFVVIESEETTHNDNPAHRLTYSFTYKDKTFQQMQYFKMKNNKIYIVSYTAEASSFDKQLPVVNSMIETFIAY